MEGNERGSSILVDSCHNSNLIVAFAMASEYASPTLGYRTGGVARVAMGGGLGLRLPLGLTGAPSQRRHPQLEHHRPPPRNYPPPVSKHHPTPPAATMASPTPVEDQSRLLEDALGVVRQQTMLMRRCLETPGKLMDALKCW